MTVLKQGLGLLGWLERIQPHDPQDHRPSIVFPITHGLHRVHPPPT